MPYPEDHNRTPAPSHRPPSAVLTPGHRPSSSTNHHARPDNIQSTTDTTLSRPSPTQLATPAAREARSKPCALHGELCDGATTLWDKEWEALRRRRGFVEPTPMVLRGNRVLVDWALLLHKAKGELARAGSGNVTEG